MSPATAKPEDEDEVLELWETTLMELEIHRLVADQNVEGLRAKVSLNDSDITSLSLELEALRAHEAALLEVNSTDEANLRVTLSHKQEQVEKARSELQTARAMRTPIRDGAEYSAAGRGLALAQLQTPNAQEEEGRQREIRRLRAEVRELQRELSKAVPGATERAAESNRMMQQALEVAECFKQRATAMEAKRAALQIQLQQRNQAVLGQNQALEAAMNPVHETESLATERLLSVLVPKSHSGQEYMQRLGTLEAGRVGPVLDSAHPHLPGVLRWPLQH